MNFGDTIAAVSSASGPAARMIVRTSGAMAPEIAAKLGCRLEDNTSAIRTTLQFSNLKCPAWIYAFRAPRTYTGQDLVEFHIPGNPLLARMLLDAIVSAGARLADPGEFTARAYFNGRIDLSQAEGVAAAIAATSSQHLAAAQRLLSGELSRRLRPCMETIAHTLALIEVGIDFSEEDVSFLLPQEVKARINDAIKMLDDLTNQSARFDKLSHQPRAVLAGRPNAGKSTLLNSLAGSRRAVVSSIAGTTRDVLSALVPLRRGMIHLIDVAGLDQSTPRDSIEKQMQQRAEGEIQSADIVILVHDITDARPPIALPRDADLIVLTKTDLASEQSKLHDARALAVVAVTGENFQQLRDRLDAIAFGSESPSASLALNARHLQAIAEARVALTGAWRLVERNAAELIAADLRQCLDFLGSILGVVSPDDILGRIFSTFCIGK